MLENQRLHGSVAEVSAALAELDRELGKPTENPVGTPTACLALVVLCAVVLPLFGVRREDAVIVGAVAAVGYLILVHDTWTRVRRRRRRRLPERTERRAQLISALGCGEPTCDRDPCREAFAALAGGGPGFEAGTDTQGGLTP